jgi:hypothetical protein
MSSDLDGWFLGRDTLLSHWPFSIPPLVLTLSCAWLREGFPFKIRQTNPPEIDNLFYNRNLYILNKSGVRSSFPHPGGRPNFKYFAVCAANPAGIFSYAAFWRAQHAQAARNDLILREFRVLSHNQGIAGKIATRACGCTSRGGPGRCEDFFPRRSARQRGGRRRSKNRRLPARRRR